MSQGKIDDKKGATMPIRDAFFAILWTVCFTAAVCKLN